MAGTELTVSQLKGLKEEIDRMENKISNILRTDDWAKSAVRVLLVGNTGSGKTTLVHHLMGCGIFAREIAERVVLEPLKILNGAVIGHNATSQTYVPNVLPDPKNNRIFYDCPGFSDTDDSRRIVNAYAIEALFKTPCQIKVLLVMSQPELTAVKGEKAKDVFDMLTQLIPDKRELKKSVGLLVSQTKADFNPFAQLELLRSVENHSYLLDYFLDEARDKVFVFPAPEDVGPYNLFSDQERVLKFLKTPPVENPKHNVVVDKKTANYLLLMGQISNEEMRKSLYCLTDSLGRAYAKDMLTVEDKGNVGLKLSNVQKWISVIEKFKNSCSDWDSFAEGVRVLRSISSEVDDEAEQINELIPWHKFLSSLIKVIPKQDILEGSVVCIHDIVDSQLNCQLAQLRTMEEQEKKLNEQAKKFVEAKEKIDQEYQEQKKKLEKANLAKQELEKKLKEAEEKKRNSDGVLDTQFLESIKQIAAASQASNKQLMDQMMVVLQKQADASEKMMQERMKFLEEQLKINRAAAITEAITKGVVGISESAASLGKTAIEYKYARNEKRRELDTQKEIPTK